MVKKQKLSLHRVQDSEAMELHDLACIAVYVLLKAADVKNEVMSIPLEKLPSKECLILYCINNGRLELKLVEPPEPPVVH